jgi:uncharacterized membrane protein YeiH
VIDASPRLRGLLFSLDVVGTFVFALEGALAAIGGHLDLLGIAVLAFATALGGGLIRDTLIGALPPACLGDWRYTIVVFAGAGVAMIEFVFFGSSNAAVLAYVDAAGLALFAISGTEKALAYHMHPVVAILLGGISGVGGGIIRDLFLARVPAVLDADFYASAALIGATAMVTARALRVAPLGAALAGITICFGLRVLAMTQHWHLAVLYPAH